MFPRDPEIIKNNVETYYLKPSLTFMIEQFLRK